MNKKFSKLAIPYLVWLFILAILPAIGMLFLMLVTSEGIDLTGVKFTVENFRQLAEPSTLIAFKNSLLLALVSTAIAIVLGYLVAYKLYRSHIKNKFLVLTILVLPMWSNILLRTEALSNFFQPYNIVSSMLEEINIHFALDIRGTMLAVIIGLVLTYFPFMIMPIYNSLEKIDPSIEEAALDLGLTDFQKFWKVILPMSSKGIITGSIMTFLPCLSGFAIPEILGQGNIVMIGNVIDQLFKDMNYNTGALLAMIILIFILASISIVNKIDKDGETLL